jgi:hypothetical protein
LKIYQTIFVYSPFGINWLAVDQRMDGHPLVRLASSQGAGDEAKRIQTDPLIHNAESLVSFLRRKPAMSDPKEVVRPGSIGGPNHSPIEFEQSEILLAHVNKNALINKMHDILNEYQHIKTDEYSKKARELAIIEQEARLVDMATAHGQNVNKWKASQANIEKTFFEDQASWRNECYKRDEGLRSKEEAMLQREKEIITRHEKALHNEQRYCEAIIEYEAKKNQIAQLLQREKNRLDSVKEADEDDSCVICLDQPKSMALIPCGHWCVCEACSSGVRKCPLCRIDSTDKLKIFKT